MAEIPAEFIAQTDAAVCLVALDRIPVIDHPLPPADPSVRSDWRAPGKQILNAVRTKLGLPAQLEHLKACRWAWL